MRILNQILDRLHQILSADLFKTTRLNKNNSEPTSSRQPLQRPKKFLLKAKAVSADDMDDHWFVGFADSESNTAHYLQLQRAFKDDEQDIKLGMNTYYLEIDDQILSCYGGIERFNLHRDRASIIFSSKGKMKLQGIETAEISFQIDDKKFAQLRDRLSKVFSGTTAYNGA